jgi:ADP-heptose:LPS heptosyltransferase
MFEGVRLKVGLAYTKFHFRKAKDQILRFTDIVNRADKALVIFPESTTDAESLEGVLKYLVRRFTSSNLIVVARKEFLPVLRENERITTIAYSEDDINAWFVPRGDLLRKLKRSTFDAAFDLNVNLALPSAFLCRASNAPLRVGFAKSSADQFYNFQIQTRARSNSSFAYRTFLHCMEMF